LWGAKVRKIQYGVAVSLDGFIAGPNGESDWIEIDPEIDFSAIQSQFDTLLMGRRTYEAAVRRLGRAAFTGKATFVFSRQLAPKDHPGVTIISELTRQWLQALKRQEGKDIWLMGGGELFRKLLDFGEVDSMNITTVPVMLGAGTPLMSPPYAPTKLALTTHRVYKSGNISMTYEFNFQGQ
jgi:dihydrofolate reductase